MSMLLQGSYAEDAFDLRIAGGPYIYKGFMIKGTVNILGWEIYAHVKLSDEVRKTTDLRWLTTVLMDYNNPTSNSFETCSKILSLSL